MNGQSRRTIEMGRRALEFCVAHPDTEPSTATVVTRLEQLVARAEDAATAQRNGRLQAHAATLRKRELRRGMRAGAIAHLDDVGRAAAREVHELGNTFRFKPDANSYLSFRTAARAMAAAAETHKEVLLRHGLSQSVLDEFVRTLDQFDEAVALGNEGRAAHVGATRELRGVSEIARTVRVMDARNRQRFAQDGQLLGSWISASTVLGTPSRGAEPEEGPPAGGEVRPAA
jgi:hypothetical protein